MENILPKRKNIRIPEYDYSKEGMYFVTICTQDKEKILSKINLIDNNNNTIVKLSNIGKIVDECINNIEIVNKNVQVNDYVIMPNHIHIIIELCGRTEASALTKNNTRI